METLISSYALDFETFNAHLCTARAYPAGSSVIRVLLADKVDYVPNDLDIWVQAGSDIGPLDNYLISAGYTKTNTDYTPNYNAAVILSVADIYSVTNYECAATDKKIQIITVECDPVHYIRKCTDLNITATYWDPYERIIVPGDKKYCQMLQFYVINHYRDIYNGARSNLYARLKLHKRIEKYCERGFTFVECPILVAEAADDRSGAAAATVFDIMLQEDRPISDYAADEETIFIRLGDNLVAVNRIELYKYIKMHGRTYWSQKCYRVYADILLYSDYSIYEFREGDPIPCPSRL